MLATPVTMALKANKAGELCCCTGKCHVPAHHASSHMSGANRVLGLWIQPLYQVQPYLDLISFLHHTLGRCMLQLGARLGYVRVKELSTVVGGRLSNSRLPWDMGSLCKKQHHAPALCIAVVNHGNPSFLLQVVTRQPVG